jgi:hypothetical protein
LVPVEPSTGAQAVKVVATLRISCGAQGNGAGCSGRHGVVELFVDLYIGAKFEATVLVVVEVVPRNECAGAYCGGDTIGRGKHIQPKNTTINHFDDDS